MADDRYSLADARAIIDAEKCVRSEVVLEDTSAEAIAAKLEDAGVPMDDARDWLAAHDAEVKAEALREAAEDLGNWLGRDPELWLRVRADQIEKGTDR